MKNITGIGGFFFRAEDPAGLKKWYIEELGIDVENYVWNQQGVQPFLSPSQKTLIIFGWTKSGC